MVKKFKRGADTTDDKGRVIVRITLAGGPSRYSPKEKNIRRLLVIEGARVSEVSRAIEDALFE